MSQSGESPDEVRAEAAQWVARMGTRPLPRETVEAFYAWRRTPSHHLAFNEASAVWESSERLAGGPAFQAMAEAALARSRRPSPWAIRFRTWAPGLVLALLVLVVVGGLALNTLRRPGEDTYITAAHERRQIALADGSRVVLGGDSRLLVRLTDSARALELVQGRAYFSVAHDATKPFTVRAGATEVTATGTQFDVRHAGSAVDVTLVEGRVLVGERRLVPGEQLQVRGSERATVIRLDAAVATAWHDDRLVLDGLTLAQAVAEVNRHAARPIILDAPSLADERIGGSFRAGDTESFVAAATSLLPLKAERDETGTIHLTKTG